MPRWADAIMVIFLGGKVAIVGVSFPGPHIMVIKWDKSHFIGPTSIEDWAEDHFRRLSQAIQ
jgi:hypothetical protein